ncbi:MAG: aminopeptidase P family N-terminal domain-containing protein, partial [Priestia megaterium]
SMEVGQAKEAGWKFDVIGYEDHQNPWELIKEALHKRNVIDVKKVAVEKEQLLYARAEELLSLYPNAELVGAEEKLNQLRLIKDEREVEILQKAAALADFGVEVGVAALKEG